MAQVHVHHRHHVPMIDSCFVIRCYKSRKEGTGGVGGCYGERFIQNPFEQLDYGDSKALVELLPITIETPTTSFSC